MSRSLIVAGLLVLAAGGAVRAEDRKADSKDGKWAASVELTDRAGKWGLEEAKVGTKMISDRDYALTDLPEEVAGGTFVSRNSAEYGSWLPPLALKAKRDATVYALVRVKYLGKETFDKQTRAAFEKEGWKPLDGEVATTFPDGEGWQWVAFKKDVKAGAINLPLNNFRWPRRTGVLFVVK